MIPGVYCTLLSDSAEVFLGGFEVSAEMDLQVGVVSYAVGVRPSVQTISPLASSYENVTSCLMSPTE